MKITDPIKARCAVAEALALGVEFKGLPRDMKDADWLELANGLLKWFLDESAKDKIHYLFQKKRKA